MMRLEASCHPMRQAALKNSDFSVSRVSGTVNVALCSSWFSLMMIVRVLVKSATLVGSSVRKHPNVQAGHGRHTRISKTL